RRSRDFVHWPQRIAHQQVSTTDRGAHNQRKTYTQRDEKAAKNTFNLIVWGTRFNEVLISGAILEREAENQQFLAVREVLLTRRLDCFESMLANVRRIECTVLRFG